MGGIQASFWPDPVILSAMQLLKYALPFLFLSLAAASTAHARGTIEKVDITGPTRATMPR